MSRLPEHDINLSKEVRILHTYSRKRQARPLDRAVTTYERERNSGTESQTKLGKRKHLRRRDPQNTRLQESDESECSRGLPTPKLQRPKRKRRLAAEQLVLLPSLSLNYTSLEAKVSDSRDA